MEKQENLHKELDLISAVITRMANNSFLVKGWAMTLMSALVVLGKDLIFEKPIYLVAMAAILLPFWWLDAFYLKQERIFRKIYERAIADPNAEKRVRYDLNPRALASEVSDIQVIMLDPVVRWFYLPFVLLLALGFVAKVAGWVA